MIRTELRTCVHCGEEKEINQRRAYANNICGDCVRARSKAYQRIKAVEIGRRVGQVGRVPYPLEKQWDYIKQKFNTTQNKLMGIKEREDWIQQLRINLDEVLENKPVMDWILAQKGEKKTKKQTKINKQYPNTRGITWEEWEALGFGGEEDA